MSDAGLKKKEEIVGHPRDWCRQESDSVFIRLYSTSIFRRVLRAPHVIDTFCFWI